VRPLLLLAALTGCAHANGPRRLDHGERRRSYHLYARLGAAGGAPLPAPAPAAEPPPYAVCAPCHGADGAGRPDGSVPRLAGQRAAVIGRQLHALRDGARDLPVMVPYARALTAEEIAEVARAIEAMGPVAAGIGPGEALERGGAVYAAACAPCHDGHDAAIVAGQHYGAILRRLEAPPDPGMAAVTAGLTPSDRRAVADFLSRRPR